MRKTNYIKLYAGGGISDFSSWLSSNFGGGPSGGVQTTGQQMNNQLNGPPKGNPADINATDNDPNMQQLTNPNGQGQSQQQINNAITEQGANSTPLQTLTPGTAADINAANKPKSSSSAFGWGKGPGGSATSTMDILGGVTQGISGLEAASQLQGAQRTTMQGDSIEKGVASGLSAFGPWGQVAGAALNLVNGIGGSLMNTNKTARMANGFTVNNDVQQSGSYGGIASNAATTKLDGTAYRKAGLFGKLATNVQGLQNQINTSNQQQTQAAGLITKGKQDFQQQAGSTDMYNSQRQQRDFNTNTWNSGQTTFGKEGMKLLPKAKDGIHIKKENIGKFIATKKKTGETTEELTHSKNPLTRKRAQFALNAKSFKHQQGGQLLASNMFKPVGDTTLIKSQPIFANGRFPDPGDPYWKDNPLITEHPDGTIRLWGEPLKPRSIDTTQKAPITNQQSYDQLVQQIRLRQVTPQPIVPHDQTSYFKGVNQWGNTYPPKMQQGGQMMAPDNYQSNQGMQIPYDYQPRLGVSKNYMSGYGGGYSTAFSFAKDSPFSQFLSTLGGAQKTSGQFSPGLESTQQMASTSTRNLGYIDSDDVDYLKGQRDSFDQLIKSQPQQQAPSAKGLAPNLGVKPIQGVKVPVGKLGMKLQQGGTLLDPNSFSRPVMQRSTIPIPNITSPILTPQNTDKMAILSSNVGPNVGYQDGSYKSPPLSRPQLVKLTGNNNLPYDSGDVADLKVKYSDYDNNLYNKYKANNTTIQVNDPQYNMRDGEHVNKSMLNDIVKASVRNKVDPYTALSIAQRESGIGNDQMDYTPRNVFSNWAENDLGNIQLDYRAATKNSGQVPASIYNRMNTYFNNRTQYPFQSEMKTINQLTKNGTNIEGYNAGDPNYANKVAKERQVLMEPVNAPFRKYVDSVANVAQHQLGGSINSSGSNTTKTYQEYSHKLGKASKEVDLKRMKKIKRKETGGVIEQELTTITCGVDFITPIISYEEGGPINIIPDGAFHSRKHDLKETPKLEDANITLKGIPVISESKSGDVVQSAEIEREELILHYDLTKELEKLQKEGTDEAAYEAGKLLAMEIVKNTKDNTGKFKLKKK